MHIVMTYIVMAYIVMAYIVMAYIVMAYDCGDGDRRSLAGIASGAARRDAYRRACRRVHRAQMSVQAIVKGNAH